MTNVPLVERPARGIERREPSLRVVERARVRREMTRVALARASGAARRASRVARAREGTRTVVRAAGRERERDASLDADARRARLEGLEYARRASEPSAFEERGFGDAGAVEALTRAMRTQWTHGFACTPTGFPRCTHGFGEILAGMQPAACDMILREVLGEATSVMDPFAGGGTTLVCAQTLGLRAVGTDVSPLACFVSAHRCWRPSEETVMVMLASAGVARDIAKASTEEGGESEDESEGDAGVPRAWRRIRDALRASTASAGDARVTEALWFCMSVALQRTQKSQNKARFRKSKGKRSGGQRNEDNADIFYKVVEEYADRLRQFREECALNDPQAPEAEIHNVDVRKFRLADDAKVDAVLTSCPYPAVYDYLSFARKVRAGSGAVVSTSASATMDGPTSFYINTVVPGDRNWPKEWMEGEIGSRRALRADPHAFRAAWQREQEEWLEVVAHSLKPRGKACIMVGDGANIDTRASIVAAAEKFGLRALAGCTMKLTTTTESGTVYNQARTEHLILFEKP